MPETITNGIILQKLTSDDLYKSIENLIINKKKLKFLQINSFKNFYLTDKLASQKIDLYREKILKK